MTHESRISSPFHNCTESLIYLLTSNLFWYLFDLLSDLIWPLVKMGGLIRGKSIKKRVKKVKCGPPLCFKPRKLVDLELFSNVGWFSTKSQAKTMLQIVPRPSFLTRWKHFTNLKHIYFDQLCCLIIRLWFVKINLFSDWSKRNL